MEVPNQLFLVVEVLDLTDAVSALAEAEGTASKSAEVLDSFASRSWKSSAHICLRNSFWSGVKVPTSPVPGGVGISVLAIVERRAGLV